MQAKEIDTNGTGQAVIYCRVSSEEQVSNTSLATQEKECRAYCKRNGLEVAKVFIEKGRSAKTIKNRPELLTLIDFCGDKKNLIQAVVVWKLDRLSRDQFDFHWLKRELSKHGVGIHSTTETMKEEDGPLMGGIYAAIAEHDNWMRAQRTKAGMKARLKAGEWTHQVPLGYTRNGNGVETCSDAGPLVRKIFEMYSTGMYSQMEILRRITKLGLRTKRGNKLTPQSLSNIVRNQLYAGWMISKTLGSEKVKANFKPLVEQELFDKVQAIRLRKRPKVISHLSSNPDFPLRAFISCGTCGKPLTGGWSKGKGGKYAYYRCYQKGCYSVKEGKMQLEGLFSEYLEQLTPNAGSLRLLRNIVKDVWQQKEDDQASGWKRANKRVEEMQKKKQRLIDLLLKGTIDETTYTEQVGKLDAEIIPAQVQLNESARDEYDIEEVMDFSERLVLNASSLWAEGNIEQRQKLQQILFPGKITYLDKVFEPTLTCLLYNDLETINSELSNVG